METETKKSALKLAERYNRDLRDGYVKVNKQKAVRELTAFGLFSPYEIASILDCTAEFVRNYSETVFPPARPPFRVWDVRTLAVLELVTGLRNEAVSSLVRDLVTLWGTSVRAIVELTDWTRAEVMEALEYDENTDPLL